MKWNLFSKKEAPSMEEEIVEVCTEDEATTSIRDMIKEQMEDGELTPSPLDPPTDYTEQCDNYTVDTLRKFRVEVLGVDCQEEDELFDVYFRQLRGLNVKGIELYGMEKNRYLDNNPNRLAHLLALQLVYDITYFEDGEVPIILVHSSTNFLQLQDEEYGVTLEFNEVNDDEEDE